MGYDVEKKLTFIHTNGTIFVCLFLSIPFHCFMLKLCPMKSHIFSKNTIFKVYLLESCQVKMLEIGLVSLPLYSTLMTQNNRLLYNIINNLN